MLLCRGSKTLSCERQILLVTVCCFVVFIEFANYFYPDWIVSFIGFNCWCFCWPRHCLFVDVRNGLFGIPASLLCSLFVPSIVLGWLRKRRLGGLKRSRRAGL